MNNPAPLAEAILIATPPLAAALIAGVVFNASLADAPGLWIHLIGGAAVGVTTLAAAAEAGADDEANANPGGLIWPLLLIWPLAFPWYMNRRDRLVSGLAGAAMLIGALGWGLHQVDEARAALVAVRAAMHAPPRANADDYSPFRQAQDRPRANADAERQARINAILDAE